MIERVKKKSVSGGNFRKRFNDLDARREKLLARVKALSATTVHHPGHKRALVLLNQTFRRAGLAQRAAILEAAAFLIDVLESLGPAITGL
ncbi:MAG: hypothetical protein JOZ70_11255 [Pseudolabrys sp.]|nr:hypothetical protein [Pseudolabrys sp.]